MTNPDSPQLCGASTYGTCPASARRGPRRYRRRCDHRAPGKTPQKFVLVLGGGYEPDQDNRRPRAPTRPATRSTSSTRRLATCSGRARKTGGNQELQRRRANRWTTRFRPKSRSSISTATACRSHVRGRHGRTSLAFRRAATARRAANLITGGVIAQLGAAPSRLAGRSPRRAGSTTRPTSRSSTSKDYHFIHVGIGSGHRAHPLSAREPGSRSTRCATTTGVDKLSQTAYDAITPIRMPISSTSPTTSARWCRKASPAGSSSCATAAGVGEKVLAEARTFNNQVFFTTFRPSLSGDELRAAARHEPALHHESVQRRAREQPRQLRRQRPADGDRSLQGIQGLDLERSGVHLPVARRGDHCVGDQCSPPPVACVDLFCFPPGFANNPVRTFWTREALD